jgi:hypothetical protein
LHSLYYCFWLLVPWIVSGSSFPFFLSSFARRRTLKYWSRFFWP